MAAPPALNLPVGGREPVDWAEAGADSVAADRPTTLVANKYLSFMD